MDAIDLRWEWRTFGDKFGDAEALVMAAASTPVDGTELYIVSDHSDAKTKIGGDVLEVKTRQQVDPHGLELWQPSLTSTFPLAAGPLEAIYRLWAIAPPPAGHTALTLATFLDDVLQKDPSLTPISVTNTRWNAVIGGCAVEMADVTFDGVPMRTIAVEHSDRERVWRTVGALGLAGRENVNYVTALKRFIAMRDRAA